MMKIGQFLDSTPKWKHSNSGVRLEAVLSNKLEDGALTEIAFKDPDTDVRIAAIQRMRNEATLNSLLEVPDDRVKASAIERLAVLIASTDEALDKICSADDPRILIQIAAGASDVDLRLESVRNLTSEESLEELLYLPNNAKVHQLCAERIEDPVRLERLHKEFLGKNKNVARITKSKLNRHKERKAANAAYISECESICIALEKLASDTPTGDFQRKLNHHVERWGAVTAPPCPDDDTRTMFATLETRFERGRDACVELLDSIAAREENRTGQAAEAVDELEEFVAGLEQDSQKLDELKVFLDNLHHKWPVGFNLDQELTEKYYRQTNYLGGVRTQYQAWCRIEGDLEQLIARDNTRIADLERLVGRIDWPERIHEPPLLISAREKIDKLKQARNEEAATRQARIESFERQIDKLDAEIKQGRIKPATKLESSLVKTLESVSVSKKLQERFSALSLQLRELKDWQGFATAQKRKELCDQMELLKDEETIHPKEKASAIKELQDKWKALGPSDSKENQRLWSRFKAAGDAAFEPCARYFDEQRALRERNLKERENICESLELFLEQNDWENPDWKGVGTIIHQAKVEWRRFQGVPNAARKKIQKRFSRVMDQLEQKLEQEEKTNAAAKEQLIQRVKQLLEDDLPVPQMVEETKRIQSEWKEVGITHRGADQKLWKEFRAQCDLVFAHRDQERSKQQQISSEELDVARAVIDRLKSLMDRDEPIHKAELSQLRSEFRKIKLHKQGAHLEKEFNDLLKDAESLIIQQARAGELQMINDLKRKANICARLEIRDITAEQADLEWNAGVQLEPELAEQMESRRRLAAKGEFDPAVLAGNQDAAELICVRMEILAGLDSPPEASERRMQYQVDRLNRGLSRGERETRSPTAQLRELQHAWYCLGPLAEDGTRLGQRFLAAEAILEGRK